MAVFEPSSTRMKRRMRFEIVLSGFLWSTHCYGDATLQDQCLSVGGGSCNLLGDSIGVGKVPVIDISALMNPDLHSVARWDEMAEAVSRACEQWGFFQVMV